MEISSYHPIVFVIELLCPKEMVLCSNEYRSIFFKNIFFYFNIKFTSELIIFDKDMMPECLDCKI